jgi:hypothetical protein
MKPIKEWVLGCTVPFTGLSALKGKMLGQNHFAKPNQHVLISFVGVRLYCAFYWPLSIERKNVGPKPFC